MFERLSCRETIIEALKDAIESIDGASQNRETYFRRVARTVKSVGDVNGPLPSVTLFPKDETAKETAEAGKSAFEFEVQLDVVVDGNEDNIGHNLDSAVAMLVEGIEKTDPLPEGCKTYKIESIKPSTRAIGKGQAGETVFLKILYERKSKDPWTF